MSLSRPRPATCSPPFFLRPHIKGKKLIALYKSSRAGAIQLGDLYLAGEGGCCFCPFRPRAGGAVEA